MMAETKNLSEELEQKQEQNGQDAVEAWLSKLIAESASAPDVARCLQRIKEDIHAEHISTGFPQLDSILGDGLGAGLYIVGGSDPYH